MALRYILAAVIHGFILSAMKPFVLIGTNWLVDTNMEIFFISLFYPFLWAWMFLLGGWVLLRLLFEWIQQ